MSKTLLILTLVYTATLLSLNPSYGAAHAYRTRRRRMSHDEYFSQTVHSDTPIHFGGDNFATFTEEQHDVCRRPDNQRVDPRDMVDGHRVDPYSPKTPTQQIHQHADQTDSEYYMPEPITNKFHHAGTFEICEIFQINKDLLLTPEDIVKREHENRKQFNDRKERRMRGEALEAERPSTTSSTKGSATLATTETDSEAPLCCFRNTQLPEHIMQEHFVQHQRSRHERENQHHQHRHQQQQFATGMGGDSNVRDSIMGDPLTSINPKRFESLPKHSAGMLPRVCCEHAMEWHKDPKLRTLCEAPIRKICNVEATHDLLSGHMHHQSIGPDGSAYFTNEHSQTFQLQSSHSLLQKQAPQDPLDEEVEDFFEDEVESSTRIGKRKLKD
eukprot:GILI01025548.1.p1 GENE.GILI01025548.1~~GILI01025548.1.p1  ORF type:complete len:385 (+),score=50.34 GILI01025548.1:97-1251(+)